MFAAIFLPSLYNRCWPSMQSLLSDDCHPVVAAEVSMALLCCNTCFITALLTGAILPICAADNEEKASIYPNHASGTLAQFFSFSSFLRSKVVFSSGPSQPIKKKKVSCCSQSGCSDFKKRRGKSPSPSVCSQSGCGTGLTLRHQRGESLRHSLPL